MGLLWDSPVLLPACTSHHGHYTTPGLDPGAYFHEISRLWKVGNEGVFFLMRRRVMLYAYLKPL